MRRSERPAVWCQSCHAALPELLVESHEQSAEHLRKAAAWTYDQHVRRAIALDDAEREARLRVEEAALADLRAELLGR